MVAIEGLLHAGVDLTRAGGLTDRELLAVEGVVSATVGRLRAYLAADSRTLKAVGDEWLAGARSTRASGKADAFIVNAWRPSGLRCRVAGSRAGA